MRKGVEIVGGQKRTERVQPETLTSRGKVEEKEPTILDKTTRDPERDVQGADVQVGNAAQAESDV